MSQTTTRPEYQAEFIKKHFFVERTGKNKDEKNCRRLTIKQILLTTDHPSPFYKAFRVTEVRRNLNTHYSVMGFKSIIERESVVDQGKETTEEGKYGNLDSDGLIQFLSTLGFSRPELTVAHFQSI